MEHHHRPGIVLVKHIRENSSDSVGEFSSPLPLLDMQSPKILTAYVFGTVLSAGDTSMPHHLTVPFYTL